MTKSKGSDPSR